MWDVVDSRSANNASIEIKKQILKGLCLFSVRVGYGKKKTTDFLIVLILLDCF